MFNQEHTRPELEIKEMSGSMGFPGTPGVTAVAEQRVPEASRVNLCSRTAVNSALASGSPLVTTLVRENSRGQTWIHLYL